MRQSHPRRRSLILAPAQSPERYQLHLAALTPDEFTARELVIRVVPQSKMVNWLRPGLRGKRPRSPSGDRHSKPMVFKIDSLKETAVPWISSTRHDMPSHRSPRDLPETQNLPSGLLNCWISDCLSSPGSAYRYFRRLSSSHSPLAAGVGVLGQNLCPPVQAVGKSGMQLGVVEGGSSVVEQECSTICIIVTLNKH